MKNISEKQGEGKERKGNFFLQMFWHIGVLLDFPTCKCDHEDGAGHSFSLKNILAWVFLLEPGLLQKLC